MARRYLAFLLFGILALVAFDSGELRANATPSVVSVDNSPDVGVRLGGNPWPPPPK
jgi:hypothetical protein